MLGASSFLKYVLFYCSSGFPDQKLPIFAWGMRNDLIIHVKELYYFDYLERFVIVECDIIFSFLRCSGFLKGGLRFASDVRTSPRIGS